MNRTIISIPAILIILLTACAPTSPPPVAVTPTPTPFTGGMTPVSEVQVEPITPEARDLPNSDSPPSDDSLLFPPMSRLIADSEAFDGVLLSYCWDFPDDDLPGLCQDGVPPNDLPLIAFRQDEEMVIQLAEPYPDFVGLSMAYMDNGNFITARDFMDIPDDGILRWYPMLQPGEYRLGVLGQWFDYGDAMILFGVRIEG